MSTPRERDAESDLADRLAEQRPVPSPTFRGYLRRDLALRAHRLPRWRTWGVVLCVSGSIVMATVAAGLVGAGPFAGS